MSSGAGFSAAFSVSNGATTIDYLTKGFGYTLATDQIVLVKPSACVLPGGGMFYDVPTDLDARKISAAVTP